jgi:hypothetical protein
MAPKPADVEMAGYGFGESCQADLALFKIVT